MNPHQYACTRECILSVLENRPSLQNLSSQFPIRILAAVSLVDIPWVLEQLREQMPEARVFTLEEAAAENGVGEGGTFDYIYAIYSTRDHLIPEGGFGGFYRPLFPLLKSDGILVGAVCGYSGYYGLVMLARVITSLIRGKSQKESIRICREVVAELPRWHPAFIQDSLMRALACGEESVFLSFCRFSQSNVFTVSELMEVLPQWGGKFVQWVLPHFYENWPQITNDKVRERLTALSEPDRSAVMELVTASPFIHYFLARRH